MNKQARDSGRGNIFGRFMLLSSISQTHRFYLSECGGSPALAEFRALVGTSFSTNPHVCVNMFISTFNYMSCAYGLRLCINVRKRIYMHMCVCICVRVCIRLNIRVGIARVSGYVSM